MEVYAFNERALRHAERAGWIREGMRRKAYLRDGAWVDGVMFGLVEEDLDEPGADRLTRVKRRPPGERPGGDRS